MSTDKTRRRFLCVSGVSVAIGLAGCQGGGDDSEAGDDADDNGDDHSHDDHDHGDDDHDHGDDEGPGSDGLLYAFAPDRAVLIDPAAGEIVEDLTDSIEEVTGSTVEGADWGDARLTRDESKLYVVESSNDDLVVIDTEHRKAVAAPNIGPGATHAYQPVDGEIWAHADDEGRLYVVDTETDQLVETVQTGHEDTGHGKLLYHDDLTPTAFATNTNDPYLHVVDMDHYESDADESIDLRHDDDEARGTHYAIYGPQNGLVYVERSGGDMMAVVDPDELVVVDWLDINGGVSLSPDHDLLGVWEDDAVHFVDVTDEDSEIVTTVDVEGLAPDDIDYYEDGGTLYALTTNTGEDSVSVIDVDAGELETSIETSEIDRDGRFVHRSGVVAGDYYATTSDAAGLVEVIDIGAREPTHEIEVSEGVDTISYVGSGGGAWY